MTLKRYYVYRTLKGTQITEVTALSRADAVRRVINGDGKDISFDITDAARTGMAVEIVE